MALPNLTRDQAAERAALVTVANYRIDLDLTDGAGAPGERTFSSVTTVEFDALAGADTYLDLAAERVRRATLNGREIDVSGYDESTGIPLRGLTAHNVVVVEVPSVDDHDRLHLAQGNAVMTIPFDAPLALEPHFAEVVEDVSMAKWQFTDAARWIASYLGYDFNDIWLTYRGTIPPPGADVPVEWDLAD